MATALAPDLVLMDVNLPGINGLDATRQLVAADPVGARSSCSFRRTKRRSTRHALRSVEPPRTSRSPRSVQGHRLEQAWAAARGAA